MARTPRANAHESRAKRMGKQSSTDPVRAAARLCGETWGRIARRCAALASVIFVGTNLAASARAQTQATTLPLILPSATAFDAAGQSLLRRDGQPRRAQGYAGRNYYNGCGQRRARLFRR